MPKGEWRSDGATRAAERQADNGLRVLNSPGFGFETKVERKSLRSNGSAKISGVEAKGQGRSIDLVMVAKASLRASERPFRVSGSGWMQVL